MDLFSFKYSKEVEVMIDKANEFYRLKHKEVSFEVYKNVNSYYEFKDSKGIWFYTEGEYIFKGINLPRGRYIYYNETKICLHTIIPEEVIRKAIEYFLPLAIKEKKLKKDIDLFSLEYREEVEKQINTTIKCYRLKHGQAFYDNHNNSDRYCEFKNQEGSLWVYVEGEYNYCGMDIYEGCCLFDEYNKCYIHRTRTSREVIKKAEDYFLPLVKQKSNLKITFKFKEGYPKFYLN